MNTHLLQTQLEDYAAAAPYPLHMPGHKRRVDPAPGLPAAWDVTEVPGVDDLHEAQGILADAMNRAAALWGAQRSWFLVNGSTGGILAAIRAAALTRPGRPIVCARNCHKSVYHAIELNALAVEWMTPPVDPAFGVYGSVTPAQAAAALDRCPGAAALVLTSPTYEGVLSDVAAIAALCHDRDVPLIVDEAHGAHYLPLAQPFGWQGGAVAAGADLVIQSPHKTLPSLTQTALLHQNGGRIPAAAVERQLDVFETSSPSYPLLASLDGCAGLLAAHGTQWFAAWRERLDRFDRAVAPLRRLRVLCHGTDAAKSHPGIFRHDGGKLLVSGAGAGWTGAALADRLRRDGFETEMACGANVLAMTSPCDAEDALDQLAAEYDFIFIDCPPSLELLTLNALCAADSILVPVQGEYFALEGLSDLMNTVRIVRRSLNPKLALEGVLLTMFDGRTNLAMQVAEEVKHYFPGKVYATVIPRNVRLSEAPSHGKPITAYDRTSRGAEAYQALAVEFLKKQ